MSLARRYVSAEWMQAERDLLWPRVWLLAGRADHIGLHERQLFTVGDQEIVLWRDAHAVRAFHNACPHRGTRLCEGGSGQTMTCPYHGWTFKADGTLLAAPGLDPLPDVRLAEVRCESRHGFVWVSFDRDIGSLSDFIAPVEAVLSSWGIERLATSQEIATDLACNWKTSVDAHSESYHVPKLHPELVGLIDSTKSSCDILGIHGHLVVPGRDGRIASDLVYVFPNTHVNRQGGEILVTRHLPHATDPERCKLEQMVLDQRATAGRPRRREVAPGDPAFGAVTNADLAIVGRVQRGMHARGFSGPWITPHERLIAHLHAGLDRYLGTSSDPTATSASTSTRSS